MAYPFGPPIPYATFIQRLVDHFGCEIRASTKLRTYARTEGRVSGEVASQGRRYKGAKVDLCRIHTDRIRQLSTAQIFTMQRRLGKIPQKERISAMFSKGAPKAKTARALLHNFLFNLWGYHKTTTKEDPEANAIYRRNYGLEPKPNREIKAHYKRETDAAEQRIWNAQAQAGCSISPQEQVARDAQREGKIGVANRIRRQGYRPHHKRRPR